MKTLKQVQEIYEAEYGNLVKQGLDDIDMINIADFWSRKNPDNKLSIKFITISESANKNRFALCLKYAVVITSMVQKFNKETVERLKPHQAEAISIAAKFIGEYEGTETPVLNFELTRENLILISTPEQSEYLLTFRNTNSSNQYEVSLDETENLKTLSKFKVIAPNKITWKEHH
jgi:aryl carrier-like protein